MRNRDTRGDVIGVIDPRNWYDTEAVMVHAGIGEVALKHAKRDGLIRGHKAFGGRIWYSGADIIALIEKTAELSKSA